MAWSALKTEHYTLSQNDTSLLFSSIAKAENLQKYVKSPGIINSLISNGDDTYLIEYIVDSETYLFLAYEDGTVILLEGLNVIPTQKTIQLLRDGDEIISDPVTIKAILTNVEGTVRWSITKGDENIIDLSSTSGEVIKVTPKTIGEATLTATLDDGSSSSCEILVVDNGEIYKIGKLSPESATIARDSTITVTTPDLKPYTTTEILNWTNSDSSVIKLTPAPDGRSVEVTGLKNGTATITAIAKNGQTSSSTITVTDSVTVTFSEDGVTSSFVKIVKGGKIPAAKWPNPTPKEGCSFDGWYNANFGGTKYDSNSTINEDITLYARWNVIVAFDSNGGSNVSSQTIAYNSKATRPNSPTRDNYSFAGWYSDAQLTNVFDFNTNITTYTKLFAKWVETGRLDTSINAEKYGYRVKGYKSANYSGYWRLFYQDKNCTYIIADPTSSTYKLSDYYTSYNSGANVSIQGRNLNNQLNSNGKFFADTNTNNNIKVTAWLTDTSSDSL